MESQTIGNLDIWKLCKMNPQNACTFLTMLNTSFQEGLNNPNITSHMLPQFEYTVISCESVRLHVLPLWLGVGSYNFPPRLQDFIYDAQALIERAACIKVSCRAPYMNLAEYLAYHWSAMGDDFGAIDMKRQLLIHHVMLNCEDFIPVM
jgi:hypothetical protein